MKMLVTAVLILVASVLATPRRAAAQVVVLNPGYPFVAPAPCGPYGFYSVPPYYPSYPEPFVPYALGRTFFGIGHYPPGYWGTDALWRATEPHVHGYRWE